eukprot:405789_1
MSSDGSRSSNNNSARKMYHIRSESSVLKKSKNDLTRIRSLTEGSTKQHPEHLNRTKKQINHHRRKRKVNRTFSSMESISFPEMKTSEVIDYNNINHRQTNNMQNTNNHKNNITEQLLQIINQMQTVLIPLQSEVSGLRKTTDDLQRKVSSLENENREYRKFIKYESHKTRYTNNRSPNYRYTDYLNANYNYNDPMMNSYDSIIIAPNPANLFVSTSTTPN